MTDNSIRIKVAVKNLKLRRKLEDLIRATEDLGVQSPEDRQRTDLLIFELGDNVAKDFEFIQPLLNSEAVGEVFLTSKNTDPQVLLKAIKTGAKEFFSLPLKEDEVRQALEKFKERRKKSNADAPVKSGRIIDVIGCKGGVGTTTVAVNLAVSLAEKTSGPSVALVDMNMLFGEIPLFLEIKPKYHWGEITKNIDRLDATFLMNIFSRHASGVHVLPSPSYLNGHRAATPEIMAHLLRLMQTMFDVVIIDGGQSLNATSLKAIEMSNEVLLISLLSLPCLSNTNKILKSFDNLGYPSKDRIRLVINRQLKNSEISLADAEEGTNKEIFRTIPNDYKTTMSAINQGKTLGEIASRAPITRSLEELADTLIPEEEKPEKKRWKFFKR